MKNKILIGLGVFFFVYLIMSAISIPAYYNRVNKCINVCLVYYSNLYGTINSPCPHPSKIVDDCVGSYKYLKILIVSEYGDLIKNGFNEDEN